MILKQLFHFSLTKIIIGIFVIGGSVALCEWLRVSIPDNVQLNNAIIDITIAIMEVSLALLSYILLYRFYEKRKINELSWSSFRAYALIGFLTGLILQSLMVSVIYLAGGYSVISFNSISIIVPAFTSALIAGVVVELIIRGIIFRLAEEKLGTVIALIISALLFFLVHIRSEGATLLSVLATTVQAGILLSAVFVYSRSLWLPVFLHFAWDFAEPGIYGGLNPGITIDNSLITSKITGPTLITGGHFGPGNSFQSIFFCLAAGLIFLWLARRKNNFINPFWMK